MYDFIFSIKIYIILILDHLAELLAPVKSVTLSDLDLPKCKTNIDILSASISIFGRQFNKLNYKYIVYLIHDDYMNNVDRFILEKNGKYSIYKLFN